MITKLREEIQKIQDKINKIQEQCSHPEESLIKEYKADTGNYDPSEDSYWVECICGLCERRWIEDEKGENY